MEGRVKQALSASVLTAFDDRRETPVSAPVFIYTRHALDNLVNRGIECGWVERTVLVPDATEPDLLHQDACAPIGPYRNAMAGSCDWSTSGRLR